MKYISIIISVLLISNIAYTQNGSLSGIITDKKTNQPLAGATIFINELKKGVNADNDGAYKTGSMAAGKYIIEVSCIGYATIIETVKINGDIMRNYSLMASVTEQQGVTVTSAVSAKLSQTPQPITVIKRNELVSVSSTNIINTISHLPGVTALTTGPAISKPFIRGLGYNRVVTIGDGIKQEGQQWGDEHGIEIDDYSVQRIEVLKGPASVMYGSDAMSGVINIQSLIPATEGTIKTDVLSEYQSNNQLRGFYGNIAGTRNGYSFNVYGSYKGASDYQNKYDGYVFNSKFYDQNFGGMIGINRIKWHSYLSVSNFNQYIGMTEGTRDSATGQFIKDIAGGGVAITGSQDFSEIKPIVPFQHVEHFKAISDNRFNLGSSKLDLIIGYQHNQRREYGNIDDINTPNAYFDLQTTNINAKLSLPYTHNWKTIMGISGMYQTNLNKADDKLIPDYDLNDVGAVAYTQYHKEKWTVSGGIRFDSRHIKGMDTYDGSNIKFNAFSKDFSNVSGSVGVCYAALKDFTLKFNLARGYRAPSLAELASNGAHEGTNRYEVGNQSLNSETSLQTDIGVDYNTDHLIIQAGIYYNFISHFIFYEKIRNYNGGDSLIVEASSGNKFNVFQFSQRDVFLYGAEIHTDFHPHPLDWLHFENTFSVTKARFTNAVDGVDYVPNIPAARYISGLKGTFFTKGKTIKNLYVGIESDYTFSQQDAFTGYNTETATMDYWLLNASIGTEVAYKNKTLFSIHFTADNLGDIAYQNHLSRLKYTDINHVSGRQGVYNMGRNFGIKIDVPMVFSWK